jgi:PBP1b-binding outer membrane lipoprotein LpoB
MKILAILLFASALAACGHKNDPTAPMSPTAPNPTTPIEGTSAPSANATGVSATPDAGTPEPPIPNDGPLPPM